MELIVRTAHGTADVSVDVHDRDVSLREVITAVTGQAAPSTARVDGRLVDASDTLDACGVISGTVVDTLLDNGPGSDAPIIAVLRQLTGRGAGRHVPLPAGHYRIGPGRRHQADELSADAADLVAFELEVNGTDVTLSPPWQASPTVSPLSLGGAGVDGPVPWRGDPLIAAGRVFRLDDGLPEERPAPHGSIDGRIAHNRPPGVVETDRTIAEAIDEAQVRSPRLWHRRASASASALSVDIGLRAQLSAPPLPADQHELDPLAVDLIADRVTAVAGTARDREALARSILIDSCTSYGPADLDVVIASPPGELDRWDWAKWLPHLRWGASVDLLTNDLEMASFAARSLARPTIVIVTADGLWNAATSPLRSIVIDGMQHASVIALTNDHSTAPSSASNIITLDVERPGAATLTHLRRDGATLDVFVPLVDITVAADVARHLAPLVDPDRVAAANHATHHVPLADIVQVDGAADRWNSALGAPGNPVEMAVGTIDDATVGVDLEINASVAVSGSSIDEAVDLATVLTLSIASTWSPSEANILIVDHRGGQNANPLQELPHHGGTFSERDNVSIDRLLTRLGEDLGGDQPSSTRLVVLINGLAETELAAPGLVSGLSSLAADSLGMHLVIATARPLAALPLGLRDICAVEIAVDGYGGTRRAMLHDRRRKLQIQFSPYDEATIAAEKLTVRPFVFGRQLSALERRLERGSHNEVEGRNSVVAQLVQRLGDLAEQQHSPGARRLLPVPLPLRLIASELWSAHTGDGVPLGVLDVADSGTGDDSADIDWWLPGADGSRLLIGSPRSGVRASLDVLLVGVADRFAAGDVHIIAIEQNDRRRRALTAVPHVSQVVSPDHDGAVEAVLAEVAQTMHERTEHVDFRLHDHPTILVLARDIERLTEPALAALTDLLADGAKVGVNVVASSARPDGIEATIAVARRMVVGSMSDTNDYARLHLERSANVDRTVGRAQMVESSEPLGGEPSRTVGLVQLADLDAPLDSVLDALVAAMQDDA